MAPERFVTVRLADPTHKLPMPGARGRLFSQDGERVDSWQPFWKMCLKDGSVVVAPPPSVATSSAAAAAGAPAPAK